MPYVVTLDALFWLAHVARDRALAQAEESVLGPAMEALLRRLETHLAAEARREDEVAHGEGSAAEEEEVSEAAVASEGADVVHLAAEDEVTEQMIIILQSQWRTAFWCWILTRDDFFSLRNQS